MDDIEVNLSESWPIEAVGLDHFNYASGENMPSNYSWMENFLFWFCCTWAALRSLLGRAVNILLGQLLARGTLGLCKCMCVCLFCGDIRVNCIKLTSQRLLIYHIALSDIIETRKLLTLASTSFNAHQQLGKNINAAIVIAWNVIADEREYPEPGKRAKK